MASIVTSDLVSLKERGLYQVGQQNYIVVICAGIAL